LIKAKGMTTIEKKKKKRSRTLNTAAPKTAAANRKSVAAFFGINKKEVDGLQFQKKVRNEWQ
jgi:hypothetical protein